MENCTETQIKAWKCNKCGYISTDERSASVCCKQYHCKTCGCETQKYHLECDSCKEKREYAQAIKMSYAEYYEKFPKNMICIGDDYYSELEDLIVEQWDNEEKISDYCWGTDEIEIKIDADSVLEDLIENSNLEDAEFSDKAYIEFREFAEKWNKKHGFSCFIKNNIVIPITEEFKNDYIH